MRPFKPARLSEEGIAHHIGKGVVDGSAVLGVFLHLADSIRWVLIGAVSIPPVCIKLDFSLK